MATNQTTNSGGIVLEMLGVAFVVLKLTHVIDWSWWYVTMPFWGPFALVLGVGLPLVVGYVFYKRVTK